MTVSHDDELPDTAAVEVASIETVLGMVIPPVCRAGVADAHHALVKHWRTIVLDAPHG